MVRDGAAVCGCGCTGPTCSLPGEVCGSNGMTYSSMAELAEFNCNSNRNVKKEYQGPCEGEWLNVPLTH